MFRTAAILAVIATSAAAAPPITQFNGYTVTVQASALNGKAPSDDDRQAAQARADEACASVDKTANMETMSRVGSFQFAIFYTCL